ncbi:hypothetical protein HYFRA_00005255 [Hymenoscyphus fraxineus]|uniref:chitinase n=1 Tax=Hymenoscyphus fraxineus TaxID=746836 RepID=A0A9N9LCZ3_9HELO|nr:hypothetical protein HYFRA_00005255 [Hymenoscyphus fraxineus]
MYFSSSILLTSIVIPVSSLAIPFNTSSPVPQKKFGAIPNSIAQQNVARQPTLPILEIGLNHIISQIGDNMTQAATEAFKNDHRHPSVGFSRFLPLHQRESPAACSPTTPCVDGSCCNSEGKCGFTPYHCTKTAATRCISNCDAHAMCGVDSLNGSQKCPLQICCSYFGYCGTSSVFCQGTVPVDHKPGEPNITFPCQEGFGSCQVDPTPTCKEKEHSASKGRKVAYWQSGNVRYRGCDKVYPSQIDTTGLTHLVFAFLFIDPKTFKVTPVENADIPLYTDFTALKTRHMQTWIAVGGSALSDPGPTFTTFSDMASTPENRAAFIASLCDFMEKYGFQGVDLDWETPTLSYRGGKQADFSNIVTLVKEMRAVFGRKFGLSIAIPTDFYGLSTFDLVAMQPSVDFFNFMAYDIHGSWEANRLGAQVRTQASILDINTNIVPLWFDGVEPDKVNLGIPYYGRGYTLSNRSCTDINCPYSGPNRGGACSQSDGILTLKEIQDLIKQKNLTPKLIPDIMQKTIVYDGDQWMGYDDAETIALKLKWADEHCLGGTVAWSSDFIAGNGKPSPTQSPPAPSIVAPPPAPSNLTPSVDGSCGKSTTCLGSAFGSCCSSYSWCGTGPDYCSIELGCQQNFGTCGSQQPPPPPSINAPAPPPPPPASASPPPNLKPSVDGTCGSWATCQGSAFGKCCSGHSWCGNGPDYCSTESGCQPLYGQCTGVQAPTSPLPPPPPPPPAPAPSPTQMTLKTSVDGSCGRGTTCWNSAFGSCCSSHSYCGMTGPHCSLDEGCQTAFGSCGKKNQIVSVDGSCNSEVTCKGSPFGSCCSKFGFCGSSPDYCSPTSGCQASSGSCHF